MSRAGQRPTWEEAKAIARENYREFDRAWIRIRVALDNRRWHPTQFLMPTETDLRVAALWCSQGGTPAACDERLEAMLAFIGLASTRDFVKALHALIEGGERT